MTRDVSLGSPRLTAPVRGSVARTGARLTEWIPGSPLTADQVTMIEDAGDNVVHDTATVDAFRLPLVPLDEQLRRAVTA